MYLSACRTSSDSLPTGGHRRSFFSSLGAAILVLLLTFTLAPPASAVYTWYQWYNGSPRSGSWVYSHFDGQARYNGMKVWSYQSMYVTVWAYIPEVGTASAAGGNVTTTFASQGGSFGCRFTYITTNMSGPLKCYMRY